jgi:hypothetical protein
MDIDGDKVDPYGDNCAAYVANPSYCYDSFDKTTFDPEVLCCICGGGEGEGGDGDDDKDDDDVTPVPIPDEDDDVMPVPDEGECVDLDDGTQKDPYGDTCEGYTANPSYCDDIFDFTEFNPSELCCACGGGQGGDGDDKDDDVAPIPDEDDDVAPIPDEDDDAPWIPTAEDLIMMFDDDFDGTLSLAEFANLYEIYCETCPFPNAEAMFNLFDSNKDGKLDAAEFEALYMTLDIDGD